MVETMVQALSPEERDKVMECILFGPAWEEIRDHRDEISGARMVLGFTHFRVPSKRNSIARRVQKVTHIATQAIINEVFRAHFPDFKYSSLEIGAFSTAEAHTDQDNLGQSAVMVIGENLVGDEGALKYADTGEIVVRPGQIAMFDGRRPHYTEAWADDGRKTRCVAVAFNHNSWFIKGNTPEMVEELVSMGYDPPVAMNEVTQ